MSEAEKSQMKKEASEESVTLSKEEYSQLLEKVKEFEATRDKLLRSAADYDNARKRLVREREEFIKFGQESLLKDLLPILDNFERALAHGDDPPQGAQKGMAAGVQLIWKQLLAILEAHGLKRFSSEGQNFDPHLHEAMDHVEEEGPEGVVVKEILSGYFLYDRVLRPAKVKIRIPPKGKKEEASQEKEEEIT